MINFERYEDELQKALYDFSKNTGITLPGWKDLVSWGMQGAGVAMTAEDMFSSLGFSRIEDEPGFYWGFTEEKMIVFRKNLRKSYINVEFNTLYKSCEIVQYKADTDERMSFQPLTPQLIVPIMKEMKELNWL